MGNNEITYKARISGLSNCNNKISLFLCCAMGGPMDLKPLAEEIVFMYPALQQHRKSMYSQLVLAWISAF